MNDPILNQQGKKSPAEGVYRQELIDGQPVAKTAGNRWHNLIATNIAIAVGSRLSGNKAEIYVNGMQVQLRSDLICYPNVVIVNGAPTFADQDSNILRNPTVVFEIISNTTNLSDKTQKLESYLAIPSVKECFLVKADEMRVEQYARQNAKQWLYRIYDERDSVIPLDAAGCKVSLSEIYANINIKQAELSSKAVN